MYFINVLFKKKYVDFVVEENLPIRPSKNQKADTPWMLIKIEKKNRNTMDIVNQLGKEFKLPRKKIGIAWLKDKHALARQWFCFHTRDIARIGEQEFMKTIQHLTKVVDYGFSSDPLNLSSQITNTFWIRLRNSQEEDAKQHKKQELTKEAIEQRLDDLYENWVWNLYGDQRFGWTHANHRIAQDIISWKRKNIKATEARFKLQALASWLFNEYCAFRKQQWGKKIVDGDIFDNHYSNIPTGPVFWDDLKKANKATTAGKLEADWMKHFEINNKMLQAFQKAWLYGRRRALRVTPTESSYRWQWDDLLLQFTLPSGSYASVLIDILLE